MEFSFACWNVYHFVSELVEEGGMCDRVVLFSIFLTCTWCVMHTRYNVAMKRWNLKIFCQGEPTPTLVSWELQGLQSLTRNLSEPLCDYIKFHWWGMLNLKWGTLIQS
jgi:hypothetical protein